jgi:hypothetical protein
MGNNFFIVNISKEILKKTLMSLDEKIADASKLANKIKNTVFIE